MDDFSTPDQTNTYGLPPSQANFIRPFKKPQSSMSPMIVTTTDGRLRAALGASGGPRIISSVIQTLFRCVWRFSREQMACTSYLTLLQCCYWPYALHTMNAHTLHRDATLLMKPGNHQAFAVCAWADAVAVCCRLIELGDDLLTAVALPRVHDQVVPNTTFVEHWRAGSATFYFPEDEIQVCNISGQQSGAVCISLVAGIITGWRNLRAVSVG